MGRESFQQILEGVVDLATPTSSALGLGPTVTGHRRPAPPRRLPRRVWLVRVSHLRPCVLQHSSPRCSHHFGRRGPSTISPSSRLVGSGPCAKTSPGPSTLSRLNLLAVIVVSCFLGHISV